ncbi:M10 family metallopeptidase C-terminal domain-containing protein [Cereibacter sphaeroides]|uniref:calcium-binding protein n=1 Tax=Cereibacter sphaeroides TaxID=1063 RepID=UPI001F411289|nr:M10 family metallopeptidase C-terminal domain-containing protein [Cereibacter sphaeroides]MCE6959379.1 M10 family metallopeptidase C-terminal domain-containing protein [Cereibacter sphaeroides]MCE6971084.1 M10 family metallopeptidase C-terminal domain-containing protein [Cereibacter sphaeroides]
MAYLFADTGFNMDQIDLSKLFRYGTWSGLYDNTYESYNGITYPDVFEVDWSYDMVSLFCGQSITTDYYGNITGGTVTGYLEAEYVGGDLYQNWGIQGIALSASALYRCATTSSTSDEKSMISAALSGADTFELSDYADVASGYNGNDKIYGYAGSDRLSGGSGNDYLSGGAGNDSLKGDRGMDTLWGGSGCDVLDGGSDSSRDIFIFDLASETRPGSSNRDLVQNFKHGIDDIDLRVMDAKTSLYGDQAFGFSGTSARANSVWYADVGSDLIVRGDVNGDKVADFEILLKGVQSLSASDFLL